jgi:bla regulator protein BlaR1
MTPAHLSALWRGLAPGLGNHLWQSTLFAAAAGLLTFVLRKNHARARYWLWLAASVKFLIPFSLLVTTGSFLAWSHSSPAANGGLYVAMEEIGQPFTLPAMPMTVASPAGPAVVSGLQHWIPGIFLATWLCGCAVVLFVWCARWRRVSTAMREAAPLQEGPEVDALRRQERMAGLRRPIEIVLSRASLEPGIFGIARPVLIWPEGISEHLEPAHLEAILAHEVWHVRRRDNLAAAVHMVVEALFWFHPLVWWLGARMVEERERACDEEVVELGSERQVYAESILKVCEFCVGSPLACVSGVTGSDLKKRMVNIMTERIARKLDFGRKLLLSTAGVLALALPIVFGLANAPRMRAQGQAENAVAAAPAYKSASIQPHRSVNGVKEHVGIMFSPHGFTAQGATLQTVIGVAYGVQADLISGAPDWVNSEKYDIDVKLPDSPVEDTPKDAGGIGIQHLRLMLQALLADRFQMTLHRQMKDVQVYELVVAEGGPKLQEAKPGDSYPNGFKGPNGRTGTGMMHMGPGELIDQGTTLEPLVEQLSWQLGHTVLDKTGLKGNYDFSLRWTPGQREAGMTKLMGSTPVTEGTSSASSEPTLFTALEEQLGLKLEPQAAPMEILVIDHVEKPTVEPSEGSTPVRVPGEVMNGLVLKKVPPDYPETARQAHLQGTVVLDATISKDGDVENLRIISGHPMLAPSAIEAVKQWKYEPYLLNGEPVEVETQLQVNFTLQQ